MSHRLVVDFLRIPQTPPTSPLKTNKLINM
jgi:hypothetical protein